ncbi:MAG: tetratricopeptide repeat protein [Woeseiaceae bacterium]|nr:tetratricopeptide repeat protein [Woeseiaceae bacterium]
MKHSLLKGFYLRDLLIEPTSGTVSGPNGTAHLQPKAIELLLYLAERPFALIERDVLLHAVWGQGHGSQEALSHAIGELRNGLNDHAHDPRLIQTVPKRGYRLLVAPRPVDGPESTPSDNAPDMNADDGFVSALMRRGVIQAGLTYLIFGWLLIQVVDAVAPIVGLPAWAPPFVIYATIGGMPVVLILAWLLEQSGGRWLLDRGRQQGKILSGLERNYLAILVGCVIAAIGATGYQVLVGFTVPTTAENVTVDAEDLIPVNPNSVAVLKFLNINNDETAQVFSDGLGEDVLDRLARIPGLSVSSRGDSWSLPSNASSNIVRKRLRVAYFLEGSVRVIDDDLRVVVQLIESATGFHVFSRSFDRNLRDFMPVQREITSLVIANIRVALPEGAGSELAVSEIDPVLDAYALYRRGKSVLDQPYNEAAIDQAIGFFQKALTIDRNYSAAHAGICRAYVTRYQLTNDSANIELAESACSAALNANPNLDVVYTSLGKLLWTTGKAAEAASAYRRALAINPNDVLAMQGVALILERDQQFEEAERMLQRAIDLQPGNWRSVDSLGALYFGHGRYADAAHAYRQVVFLDPDNWQDHGNLGSALLMLGDFNAALDAFRNSLKIERTAIHLSNLGIIYYYLGDYDRSVEIHRQAAEEMPEDQFGWLNLGDALRFSSQPNQAAAAYQKAFDIGAELLETNPNDPETLYAQAWAIAATGHAEEARNLIERALGIVPSDPYARYYDGLLKHDRGEAAAAIDALRLAVDMGYPVAMLAADPLLGDLHGDVRFEGLIGENSQDIR